MRGSNARASAYSAAPRTERSTISTPRKPPSHRDIIGQSTCIPRPGICSISSLRAARIGCQNTRADFAAYRRRAGPRQGRDLRLQPGHSTPLLNRLHGLRKKAENCHSEPAAAGEESLLVFCLESGGILRFARNDNQSIFSATCLAAGAAFGCGFAALCVPYVASKSPPHERQRAHGCDFKWEGIA
jgi:hypothetical protein